MGKPSITVIIPNYNGERLLSRCLKALKEALAERGKEHQIILIDDASTDSSVSVVRRNFPEVQLVILPQNRGFSAACNRGAAEASADFLLFLNTDIVVRTGFLEPLLAKVRGTDVFAAGSMMLVPEVGMRCASLCKVKLKKGMPDFIWPISDPNIDVNSEQDVLYVAAACLLIDKEKFDILGGFDELYQPFYWEDLDLCYRAWKRGWRTVYMPESVVEHHASSTIDEVANVDQRAIIFHRNSLLFMWKNMQDPRLLVRHLLYLPLHLGAAVYRRRWWFLRAFFGALRLLPQALRRRSPRRLSLINDRELLEGRLSISPKDA